MLLLACEDRHFPSIRPPKRKSIIANEYRRKASGVTEQISHSQSMRAKKRCKPGYKVIPRPTGSQAIREVILIRF